MLVFNILEVIVPYLLQVGKLSTGDSLDMSPHDESAILNNDATVKDMEVSIYFCSSIQLKNIGTQQGNGGLQP